MSARPHRHGDGVGRKRIARTGQAMTPREVATWVAQQVGGEGYDAFMPRGTEVEWYSPATEAELALEAERAAAEADRLHKWEVETYARLHAKFGGLVEVDDPDEGYGYAW